MKKYLILLILVFVLFGCKEDKNKQNIEKVKLVKLPPPPKIIDENSLVGFACYYSGRKSKPVENITEIILNKKYAELKEKLFSKKPAEKYLATFACLKLFEKGIIKLDEEKLKQIESNKRSNLKIYFCGGCTEQENFKLSQLLNNKTDFAKNTENWFNKIK